MSYVVVARCQQGALFETLWVPFVSFKALRLGGRRYQRCPVHRRPEWVTKLDPATLSSSDRAAAAEHPAGRVP